MDKWEEGGEPALSKKSAYFPEAFRKSFGPFETNYTMILPWSLSNAVYVCV